MSSEYVKYGLHKYNTIRYRQLIIPTQTTGPTLTYRIKSLSNDLIESPSIVTQRTTVIGQPKSFRISSGNIKIISESLTLNSRINKVRIRSSNNNTWIVSCIGTLQRSQQ